MTNLTYRQRHQSAVALAYGSGQASPRVVAKGRGELAERIIDRAREAGVFVHESPELVNLLMQVDLDSNIPPELYQAVAEVLAFVYFLEREAGGDTNKWPELPLTSSTTTLPSPPTSSRADSEQTET